MEIVNLDTQKKLDELYTVNYIVRYCIDAGKRSGMDNMTILAEAVIALASHNEELKGMLLKVQMEMPARPIIK